MKRLDLVTENFARIVAQRSSRRGFLGSLGALMVGTATLPLLPVARGAQPPSGNGTPAVAAGAAHAAQDPSSCEYWRHCAIDGYLCSCCGGTQSVCPPGTEQSPVTWVGTCHNPADARDYVISYNDCCGKSTCGRCLCNRNEGDSPLYVPFQSNDYDWCAGSHSDVPYNCSTARIVALAK